MKTAFLILFVLSNISAWAQAQSGALCAEIRPLQMQVDGELLTRYNISKPEHMRCVPAQADSPWQIQKHNWDHAEEQLWQDFIRNLGNSTCNTVDTCLASKANILRTEWDQRVVHYADCADFPLYLRAYFSYKRSLPFSMGLNIQANPLTEEQELSVSRRRVKAEAEGKLEEFESRLKDLRYTANGNRFTSRLTIPSSRSERNQFFAVVRLIHHNWSTGSYRMLSTSADRRAIPDFYSPKIQRESIQVGTVLYKPSGHIAIVYEVTPEGEIKYLDAHPDNSVTRGRFTSEFMRSTPEQGSVFKNWRPFRYENGSFRYLLDNEIADYSLEQYYGSQPDPKGDWTEGKFSFHGRPVDFYEYIKARLYQGTYKLDPLLNFQADLDNMCADFQGRARSVDLAVQVGLHTQSHPTRLPENIYGAHGDWETYSTPGRDLRLRRRVLSLIESAQDFMRRWREQDPIVSYSGQNLAADLLSLYLRKDASCKIEYKNSVGESVVMGLSTAIQRLTLKAFDPYLCPELRWGPKFRSELQTCSNAMDQYFWYEYQQFLRNRTERDPSEVMGWSLDELQKMSQEGVVENKHDSEDYNIIRHLRGLR